MARDRANINTAIWTSDDFRDLTGSQQRLYFVLATHPSLSYVGVGDWRLSRLAAMASDTTPADVQHAAEGLQEARFVFIDEGTEEILVRSFMRHDGLLKQPKLSISMVNAYGEVASKKIREIVTFELQRLHAEYPEWAAFRQEKVMSLVKGKGTDMAAFCPTLTPELSPSFTLNAAQADPLRTTTATTTATEAKASGSPRKRGTRISEDFAPTPEMIAWARENTPDVNGRIATQKFINHWTAKAGKDAVKLDWPATWRNWMLSDQERAAPTDGGLTTSEKRIAANAAALNSYEPTTYDNPFEQKAIQL